MNHNLTTSLIAMIGFILFSIADSGIKIGSPGYSSLQVACVVSSFALCGTLIYMAKEGVLLSPWPAKPWLMALRTLIRLIQLPCLYYAFANFPMALVYAAVFCMPLATNALNAIFLKDKIGPRRIAAITIGFGGVLIALNPAAIELELAHLTLAVLTLAGALDSVIVRMTAQHEKLSLLNFWPVLLAIIFTGALSAPDFKPMPMLDILIFIGTAVAGWIAALCYMHALRRGPVVSASSMQYSQVLWGGLLGYFVFDEAVSWHTIVGSLVIVFCGLYIMLRNENHPPQQNPEQDHR